MSPKQINRNNTSANFILPAPIGGLNVRDSLDTMAITDAIVMDNYLPIANKVVLRKGYVSYVNLGCRISTLVEYCKPGNNKFFAFGNGKIWDITNKEDVKEIASDFSHDYWQYVQFKDYLILVNGYDAPQTFYSSEDGDNWQEAMFEGINLQPFKLINVTVSKQRLFFVEKGSLNAWYSQGAGEVRGTLVKFDLSSIFRKGGELLSIASWTQDAGQGVDDLTVFITSEGEIAVYGGNDPGDASDWSLRGVFQMSRPIGYRCAMQYQGDIVIISEDGYIPMSKALSLDKANSSQVSFSDKIRGLVLERTQQSKDKTGWQSIIYSRGGYAIFNVPVAQQFEQHVVNVNSGAWCRFTDIRSFCWGTFGNRIFFGSDNAVFLFDEGYSDNGVHICGTVEQAYSDFGTPNLKRIQLINPRTKSSAQYALIVYTNMDFSSQKCPYMENIGHSDLNKWNSTYWSCLKNPVGSKWATLKGKIRSQWIANSATGFKASVVFKTKTRGNLIEWFDTGVRYEQGCSIM